MPTAPLLTSETVPGGQVIPTARRHGDVADQVGRLRRPALALARRLVADQALAEDAVQDALLAAWRRADSFDPARGDLATWFLTLVHHKAVDLVRREQAHQRRADRLTGGQPDSEDPGVTDIADLACQRVADGRVREALGRLPATQREALVLGYWGGFTQREIAELTGAPLGTVKTRMLAGMRGLQRILAPAVRPA